MIICKALQFPSPHEAIAADTKRFSNSHSEQKNWQLALLDVSRRPHLSVPIGSFFGPTGCFTALWFGSWSFSPPSKTTHFPRHLKTFSRPGSHCSHPQVNGDSNGCVLPFNISMEKERESRIYQVSIHLCISYPMNLYARRIPYEVHSTSVPKANPWAPQTARNFVVSRAEAEHPTVFFPSQVIQIWLAIDVPNFQEICDLNGFSSQFTASVPFENVPASCMGVRGAFKGSRRSLAT